MATSRLATVGRVDPVAAARGASSGFSVLMIGGLMAPIVAVKAPSIAAVWLTATAVIAFVVAAWRPHRASSPAIHGCVAALASYILVLPLILPFKQGRDPWQIGLTTLTAVVVGAMACMIGTEVRRRRAAQA